MIKTHAPEQLSPWVGGTGAGLPTGSSVIVVTRNPFDTAVSLFNHASDVPIFEYTGDFDHFLKKLFIPGSVEHGYETVFFFFLSRLFLYSVPFSFSSFSFLNF